MLDEASFRRVFDLFQQHAGFTWKFQLRQLEMQAHSGGPWWVYALLAFFVLKEAVVILRDPVLLLLTALIVYFFCLGWIEAQWERFLEQGPQQVVVPARMVVAKIGEVVKSLRGRGAAAVSDAATHGSKKHD